MKRIMLLFVLLMIVSLACAENTAPLATPTVAGPNPAEIAATMLANQVGAAATSQSVNLQLTATAYVIVATQTAQQASAYAIATQQARRDAEATSEQKRSDIAATQQRKDIEATAIQSHIDERNTQSALATQPWDDMTKAAVYPHATLTQMAVNNAIVINTQDVARSGLQLKQQQDTNVIQWLVPTSLAVLAGIVGAAFVFNRAQLREIKDEDGNVELLILKNQKAIRPRLMPRALLELGEDDIIDVPAAEQAEVVKRAQAIDALAAMPIAPTQAGVQNFNATFWQQKQDPRFALLSEGDMPPAELLNTESLKSIEGDWKDSNE